MLVGLVLCLTFLARTGFGQEQPLSIGKTADGQGVILGWPADSGAWILGSNTTLDPAGWTVVAEAPTLDAGRFSLELPFAGERRFFRLQDAGFIFVDGSNPGAGDGSRANPFRSINAGLSEAKARFQTSGVAPSIYVFEHDYTESIALDGADSPGLSVTIFDSSVTVSFNGEVLGGGMRARLAPPAGQRGVDVREMAGFTIAGFEVTSSRAEGMRVSNLTHFSADATSVTTDGGPNGIRLLDVDRAGVRLSRVEISNTGGAGIDIDNVGGRFEIDDRDLETPDDTSIGPTGTGAGIDIANSSGTFRFLDLELVGTGSHGVRLSQVNQVHLNTGKIEGAGGDAIHSVNTSLETDFLFIGITDPIAGDGCEVINNDGEERLWESRNDSIFNVGGSGWKIESAGAGTLSANLIAPFCSDPTLSSLRVRTGSAADSLHLNVWGFSFTGGAENLAVDVEGALPGTLIVSQFDGGQITSNIGNASGAEFENVVFDADPVLSGVQPVIGARGVLFGTHVPPNVPANVQRHVDDVLAFIECTGEIRFAKLDIAGKDGAGVLASHSLADSGFVLGVQSGTIDVNRGPALDLRNLEVDLTFSHVRSRDSPTSGARFETVGGSVTVTDQFTVVDPSGRDVSVVSSPDLAENYP